MTIDEALRARANEALRINIFPISQGYQVSLSTDNHSWRVEMGPDPAAALSKVLGLTPGASGPLWQPEEQGSVFE